LEKALEELFVEIFDPLDESVYDSIKYTILTERNTDGGKEETRKVFTLEEAVLDLNKRGLNREAKNLEAVFNWEYARIGGYSAYLRAHKPSIILVKANPD